MFFLFDSIYSSLRYFNNTARWPVKYFGWPGYVPDDIKGVLIRSIRPVFLDLFVYTVITLCVLLRLPSHGTRVSNTHTLFAPKSQYTLYTRIL